MDFLAWAVALAFGIDGALLLRRFVLRRNWLIFSAIMPRLALAIIYSARAMDRMGDEAFFYNRLALIFMGMVAIAIHVLAWNDDR